MDASCKIQRSIHDVRLTYKYVSRILGTYHPDIFKFFNKAFVHGTALTHLVKGFNQYLIKIPVYQVIFVLKISVKGLSGHTTCVADFLNRNFLDRRGKHAFLHGIGQLVFYIVVHIISLQ